MTDGLMAVQSRIAQLRALVAPVTPLPSPAKAASGFDGALATAMGTTATGSSATSASGSQAVDIAKKYLGVPYKWGGTDPKTGLDCSGLTKLVYKQLGVELPRVSRDQAKVGTEVSSLKDAKPGDLVFFDDPVDHVGIYVGNGKMLDAPKTGDHVRIRDVWETPSHIRRVLPESSAAQVSALSSLAGTASAASSSKLDAPYANLFESAGRKYGVDPALLAAVAKAESGFNPKAKSHAGAQGMMQIMPGTARDLGVKNPYDPAQAVDGAAKLLSQHLRSFNGRTDLALAAYNAGAGNVRKYGGIPPFQETQTYVQRVTKNWGELR